MKRAVCILLVLAVMFSFSACGSDRKEYKSAVSAMEMGNYAAAAEKFGKLGIYKDSAELALDCEYLDAVALYNKGNYEAAKIVFDLLGDYKDSPAYSKRCDDGIFKTYLTGKWVSQELDVTDIYESRVRELFSSNEKLMRDFEPDAFNIVINIKFTSSGTFVLSVDSDRLSASVDGLIADIKDSIRAYAEEVYAGLAQQHGLSMEELYDAYSVDNAEELFAVDMKVRMDDYISSVVTKDYLIGLVQDMCENGTYEVKDGRILLHIGTRTVEAEFDKNQKTLTVDDAGIGYRLILGKA